jgi:hypothetical protein
MTCAGATRPTQAEWAGEGSRQTTSQNEKPANLIYIKLAAGHHRGGAATNPNN